MKRLWARTLVFCCLGLLAGCGNNCKKAPCTSYVNVAFSDPLTQKGHYVVEVIADGEAMGCDVHLPQTGHDHCDERVGIVWDQPSDGEAGAGGASGNEVMAGIGVIGVYSELSVVVRYDGQEIVSEDFSPEYDVSQGQACGQCPQAEYELKIQL